jgi:UDP-N-acetylglucosamine diphosphorylase/glucosamine-1-phosphate N-acetyltransferase
MNIVLIDPPGREKYFPLASTRPVGTFRVGILTIAEKWQTAAKCPVSFKTTEPIQEKYPCEISEDTVFVNAAACPNPIFAEEIKHLKPGDALKYKGELVAAVLKEPNKLNFSGLTFYDTQAESITVIEGLPDIFTKNDVELREDFNAVTNNRVSQPLHTNNTVIGDPSQIFLEEGAVVNASILNTQTGPIYIGKNAEVMEGCMIRGPFAMGEHSIVKMGAKIYGATTLGPECRAGGEVNNTVMFGYSNKGHDGFLGNSVLGEWCNIGADSNNSNLKNNYAEVKLWSYKSDRFERTGLQFCGLIMGDHSKCGINTMFNTGTVVGVACNVFGSGFPRNFIPDFSWGGAQGMEVYQVAKVMEVAELVMERRHLRLSEADKKILHFVFEQSTKYRKF